MREITYQGQKGVFYPEKEFNALQNKILEQKELIEALQKEVYNE